MHARAPRQRPHLLTWLLLASLALPGPALAEQALSPDELDRVVTALRDRSGPMKVRLQAALILSRSGEPEAVPALVDALDDPDFPVRAAASMALGNVGDARAADALLHRLEDPQTFVRDEATEGVQHLIQRGYGRAVEDAARHADPEARAKAVALGAALGESQGTRLLAKGIADPDLSVRNAAAQALAGWPPPEAQRFLLAQLASSTPHARAAAARLCGEKHVSLAVPALMQMLVSTTESSEDVDAARNALHDLADQLDLPVLQKQAHHGTRLEREQALAVLASIRDAGIYDLLVATLDDPDVELRGAAALDLGVFGDPRAAQKISVLAGRPENESIQRTLEASLELLRR